ncbi:MAG: hypothetical protein KDC24_05695 [Saprospiraceae bacterium]|nr:hypothetical protein [Saprospiraceae bacterium]
MKTRLLTISFVLLFIPFVQAQIQAVIKNIDGTYITTSIDKKTWENEKVIQVLDGTKLSYKNLTSIEVEDRKYEILHFESSINKTNIKDYNTPIFTEVLAEGTVDLFAYQKAMNEVKYFIRKGEEISILEQEEYIQDNKAYAKKLYLGILMIYLNDCPAIPQEEINSCQYDSKALKKLVTKYNKACGSFSLLSKKKPVKFAIYPSMGYKFFSSKISSGSRYHFLEQNVNYPFVGAGLRFNILKKPSIYLTSNIGTDGFAFYTDTSLVIRNSWPYDSFYYSNRLDVSYYNINLGIGTTYEFDNGTKILLEFLVDVRDVVKIKANQYYRRQESRIFGNNETSHEAVHPSVLASQNLNYKIQLGIHWKSIELFSFYQFGTGGITNSKGERSNHFGAELRYVFEFEL